MEQEAASVKPVPNPVGKGIGQGDQQDCACLSEGPVERVEVGKLMKTIAKLYCVGCTMPLIVENYNGKFIVCFCENLKRINKNKT